MVVLLLLPTAVPPTMEMAIAYYLLLAVDPAQGSDDDLIGRGGGGLCGHA